MFFLCECDFFFLFFYHDYSVRKSLVCVCVCKYTQPYFQSGTAWPPLCAFPCSPWGMCTMYRFSLNHSLKTWDFSWLGSCLLPCLYPQHPSITTLPVGWMLSSPVSKASPAPTVPAARNSVSLVPGMLCQEWSRGCGFAAEL